VYFMVVSGVSCLPNSSLLFSILFHFMLVWKIDAISFSQQLWENNLIVANEVLDTPFLRAIADGSLPPDVYGAFIMQDIYYCEKAQVAYEIGINRTNNVPSKKDLQIFFEERLENYVQYNGLYRAQWQIAPSCIKPLPNTSNYVQLESDIAENQQEELLAVVMTPCMVLWDWLGSQLLNRTSDSNPYLSFIKYMRDPDGVEAMNSFLDILIPSLDEAVASEVYHSAILGELGMFNSYKQS